MALLQHFIQDPRWKLLEGEPMLCSAGNARTASASKADAENRHNPGGGALLKSGQRNDTPIRDAA